MLSSFHHTSWSATFAVLFAPLTLLSKPSGTGSPSFGMSVGREGGHTQIHKHDVVSSARTWDVSQNLTKKDSYHSQRKPPQLHE